VRWTRASLAAEAPRSSAPSSWREGSSRGRPELQVQLGVRREGGATEAIGGTGSECAHVSLKLGEERAGGLRWAAADRHRGGAHLPEGWDEVLAKERTSNSYFVIRARPRPSAMVRVGVGAA
jgi:hypothetical protein